MTVTRLKMNVSSEFWHCELWRRWNVLYYNFLIYFKVFLKWHFRCLESVSGVLKRSNLLALTIDRRLFTTCKKALMLTAFLAIIEYLFGSFSQVPPLPNAPYSRAAWHCRHMVAFVAGQENVRKREWGGNNWITFFEWVSCMHLCLYWQWCCIEYM